MEGREKREERREKGARGGFSGGFWKLFGSILEPPLGFWWFSSPSGRGAKHSGHRSRAVQHQDGRSIALNADAQ